MTIPAGAAAGIDINVVSPKGTQTNLEKSEGAPTSNEVQDSEFVNQQGVTFEKGVDEVTGPTPYGLPCVRELFRYTGQSFFLRFAFGDIRAS